MFAVKYFLKNSAAAITPIPSRVRVLLISREIFEKRNRNTGRADAILAKGTPSQSVVDVATSFSGALKALRSHYSRVAFGRNTPIRLDDNELVSRSRFVPGGAPL